MEEEVEKMGSAYNNLILKAEERENMDRMLRMNLESEVLRLNEDNSNFKGGMVG